MSVETERLAIPWQVQSDCILVRGNDREQQCYGYLQRGLPDRLDGDIQFDPVGALGHQSADRRRDSAIMLALHVRPGVERVVPSRRWMEQNHTARSGK